MKKWLTFAIAGVLIFVGFTAMSSSTARSMVFPAPSIKVPDHPPAGFIEPKWDLPIHGWLYQPGQPVSKVALLYFHGNGENLETLRLSGMLEELQQFQIPFLLIDYPGYGRSEGSPSEETILRTSLGASEWLTGNFADHSIVLCGWSLGASVAIQTAAQSKQVDGLIALSAWTTLTDIATRHYPKWITDLLLKDRFDALNAAKHIQIPALLIHGEEDDLIPAAHGTKVANAFPVSPRWVLLPNVGHNDLLSQREVWQEIGKFLRELDQAR